MALVKVRYKGLSDIRSMSVQELADAGIGVSADLEWRGIKPVVIKDPSDDLLEVFRREGTFVVSEVGEDGTEGDVIIEHTKIDDTGDTVIDDSTGQVSAKPGASEVNPASLPGGKPGK